MKKEKLFGKTLSELEEVSAALGLPRFTAAQITDWLYKKQIGSIDEMTNLSFRSRKQLQEKFDLGLADPVRVEESKDGTKKYLYRAGMDRFVEAAYIPENKRATLCVSSQIGCKMGCLFCMTGRQGFQGQLTAGEILNQVHRLPEKERLTNIVFMGMGEPLDNPDHVLTSIEILTASWGYGWSPRRITLSTIGVIPVMKRFIEQTEVHLAISLHTPFEEERRKLIPVEKLHPLRELMKVIRSYNWYGQRRVSFEYILFRGLNDTPGHVKELARLLNGLKCRVNLIRFHKIPDTSLKGSDDEALHWFRDQLNQKGILATIRASRGEDIAAACGLLSTRENS